MHISEVKLPCGQPFVTAIGSFSERGLLVLRVAQDGVVGYGEASPLPGFSDESLDDARQDLVHVQRVIADVDLPTTLAEIEAWMRHHGAPHLCASARFAVETALLDRVSRLQRSSMATVLGDHRDRVPVNATITAQAPPVCFAQAMSRFDEGFRVFKVKVGVGSLAQDVARLKAVRDAIGDAARIRLDANGAWSIEEAITAIKALSVFGVEFIEQPVLSMEAMSVVHGVVSVPLAVDEDVRTVRQFDAYLNAEVVNTIVLKPALLGSLIQARALAIRAKEQGHRVIVTTSLDGAIGRAATAHLCASLSWLDDACGLATGGLFSSDVTLDRDRIHDGYVHLQSPGHGVHPELVSFDIESHDAAIDVPAWSATLPLPLAQRALFYPETTALIADDVRVTYGALWQRVERHAATLHSAGIKKGDRVAIWGDNAVELVSWLHAIMALGAVMVPLHPSWSRERVVQQAQRSRCRMLLVDDARAHLDYPESLVTHGFAAFDAMPRTTETGICNDVALDQAAAILFTSGTTGQPKMVLLTWGNLMFSATGSAIQLGHLPSDQWLCVLPICHVAGLSIVFRCALLGTTMVLHDAFDPGVVAESMVAGQVTLVSLVSKMLQEVLVHLNGRQVHPIFRAVLLGGGAIPDTLLSACAKGHVPVSSTYGMTEASSQLTTHRPGEAQAGHGAGAPLIWTRIRLADEDERGGRVLAKSPTCSVGYIAEQPDGLVVNAADEWFDTGDDGCWHVDQHGQRLHLLDRRTDLIVSGGENVSPQRVESVLLSYPKVKQACAVGLPDEQWGARVEVVVVSDSAQLDATALIEWCKSHLAVFEVPKAIHQWSSLPTSTLEKISRVAVRTRLLDEDQGRGAIATANAHN